MIKKLTKLTKTLLVAAGLCVGATSAWGTIVTWHYDVNGSYSGGQEISPNTDVVEVTIGASGESWEVWTNSSYQCIRCAEDTKTPTLTDNVPTAGTFIKVVPKRDISFILDTYTTSNYNPQLTIVDGNTVTKQENTTLRPRYNATVNYTTLFGKFEAGKTYYLYGGGWSSNCGPSFGIRSFSIATYEDYTINYKYGEDIIKSESGNNYQGATVDASYTSFWDDGGTTKYYVADNATTSFTVGESSNTFDVTLRLAATDAVATVNAVDGDGNVLKSFTATGVEGESSGYIFYTRVVKYGNNYYAVPASNHSAVNYAKSGVVFGGNPVSVEYSLDNTIAYYAEIEDMEANGGFRGEEQVKDRASGGDWHRLSANAYRYSPSGELNPGVYSIEFCGRNQGGSTQNIAVKVRSSEGILGDAVSTLSWETSSGAIHYDVVSNILVPSGSSIAVCEPSGYTSNIALDYVIIRKLYVFTEVVGKTDKTSADRSVKSSDIVLKNGDVYNVKFCNYGSDAANKNNFIVLINNAASMYADWFDYLQNKGGWATDGGFRNADLSVKDPYQASTDGGSTSGNLDWANYSGIRKSIVDLTIKYKDGKVTIEGSATSIDDPNYIYYYGYAYTVADAEADATVNLSVCLSWLGIVSVDKTYVGATISDAKYASFSSTKALDFSSVEGLTAFIATGSEDNNVTLEEVNDAQAGTGLVLKGDAKTYSIPVIASGTDHSATNKLWAITSDDMVGAANDENYTNYVLALQGGKVVFAPVTGDNTAQVKAGQAALSLQTAGTGLARALSISFDDEATGIYTVESNTSIENDAIYNLRGQRVSQPTKGLYIVGGKKVMVK